MRIEKENREHKDSVFVDLFYRDETAEKNLLSLYNALHGTEYRDEGIIQKVGVEDVLYKNFKNDISFEVDGQVVGHCGVTNVLGEGYITNVAVLPAYRNRKIGQKLLAALLEAGEMAGISAFTLEVRASNESAICVYEKAGFVSAGVRPGFYDSPKEDALIMWKR